MLTVPWLPEQGSTQAVDIDRLYDILAVVSVFVFALVVSIILVSVWHFRRRPGQLEDGPPIHGHTGAEITWTAIPAVMVTAIAIGSAVVLADMEKPQPNSQIVHVNSQQFAWDFTYEGLAGVKAAGVLHLVKDRPYYFKIKSRDVLHSFWVPEFRVKKDAVPGITTDARVTPTRIGRYEVVCAELCGLGHSTMRAEVVVEDQQSFDRWARSQAVGSRELTERLRR